MNVETKLKENLEKHQRQHSNTSAASREKKERFLLCCETLKHSLKHSSFSKKHFDIKTTINGRSSEKIKVKELNRELDIQITSTHTHTCWSSYGIGGYCLFVCLDPLRLFNVLFVDSLILIKNSFASMWFEMWRRSGWWISHLNFSCSLIKCTWRRNIIWFCVHSKHDYHHYFWWSRKQSIVVTSNHRSICYDDSVELHNSVLSALTKGENIQRLWPRFPIQTSIHPRRCSTQVNQSTISFKTSTIEGIYITIFW